MLIGVPKEVKTHEYRVALLPVHVEHLKAEGHQVVVESRAGLSSGASDIDYIEAGAEVVSNSAIIFKTADMIVKVKEPQDFEVAQMQPGQVVFTYFHFAAAKDLLQQVQKQGIIALAYETIQTPNGQLPLLTPMSEIAGRMAVHEGAKYLEEPMKGRGILLAGVPGVEPAKVVILGGGVVGLNAAKMAAGLGADVRLLDVNLDRLRYLDDILPKNVKTLMSNLKNIRTQVAEADLLIGAVLLPGKKTPILVTEEMVKTMKAGAVIVDVGIDQGGCVETARPTTHEHPTYMVHGVVHYCVANMPGAVARTSTKALTNATFPYIAQVARHGWEKACEKNPALKRGLNVVKGEIVLDELKEL